MMVVVKLAVIVGADEEVLGAMAPTSAEAIGFSAARGVAGAGAGAGRTVGGGLFSAVIDSVSLMSGAWCSTTATVTTVTIGELSLRATLFAVAADDGAGVVDVDGRAVAADFSLAVFVVLAIAPATSAALFFAAVLAGGGADGAVNVLLPLLTIASVVAAAAAAAAVCSFLTMVTLGILLGFL